MALFHSSLTVGGYTLVSRVLGFIRDVLIAAFLGAGPVADAFFVAFRIPNFLRRLFAEGAFNAAFVPLFSHNLEKDGRAVAEAFATQILSILLTALVAITLFAEAAMPAIVAVIAPGFVDEPDKFDLAVDFTRLTFPYLLFMGLTALYSGILNSLYRFAAAAAAPMLLNVVMIAALLLFARDVATLGYGLSFGVALAGLLQFLLLKAAVFRAGVRLPLRWPRWDGPLRRFLRLLAPAAIGAGVIQINLLVGTILASLLPTGAVSYLYYADRVNQLPLGVVGIAVGTALLPLLSRQLRAGDPVAAQASQNRALEVSLLLTLPSAAALITVPGPMISVLFERGAFDAAAAQATAATLAAFATGLPAYVLVRVLQPAFYARHDTATPVKIAGIAVAANIVLSLLLILPLAHVGIALATALASWLNAALLMGLLWRRGDFRPDGRLRRRLPRLLLASALMAAGLILAAEALAPAFAGSPPARGGALLALLAVGGVLFAGAALLLGAVRVDDVPFLRRRRPPS